MSVGLGLPFGDPAQLLTWARRADAAPFSSLALPARPGADCEPLTALAALAGATSRIRLRGRVPAGRHGTALLAAQAATLHALSGGRCTLTVGPDAGADDGAGFLGVPLPLPVMDRRFREVEAAWSRAGRAGRPRLPARVDVALGPPSTLDGARRAWRAHRAPAPGCDGLPAAPDHILNGLLTSRDGIRDAVAGCLAVGADEVLLCCWSPDPDQVGRIADAVFPPDGDWPGLTDD